MRTDLIIFVFGLICLALIAGCASIPEKTTEEPAEEVSQETAEPAEQPEEPAEEPKEPAEAGLLPDESKKVDLPVSKPTPLKTVLEVLQYDLGVNLTASPELEDKELKVMLVDVPWRKALDEIAALVGGRVVHAGPNWLRIVPGEEKPEPAEQPEEPTEEPEEPAEQPEEPMEEPEEPAEQPEEPTEEPEEPAEQPEEPTEEPKEEPTEEAKAEESNDLCFDGGEYLPGKGFRWKTKDGNFDLRIGGRFQFHWILDDYDIHRTTRLENNAEFGIPRAYLFFCGHAYKEIKYMLNYRIDTGVFDDWAITYTPKELQKKIADMNLDITAGHFKPRFSREFLTSSGGFSLVNRNLADAQFRLGRDYGVNFTGKLLEKKLRIDLGLFNGLADSSTDNAGFRITVRAQYDVNKPPATQGDFKKSPKPAFSLGLAYSLENDIYDFDGNSVYDDNGSRFTFDWTFYWKGLNVIGAYFTKTEQNQKTTGPGDPNEKNRNSYGYSLQGSYFVLPGKLELITAMSYVVPDIKDARARKGSASGWKHENRFGVGYYIKGHALKIQADYGTIRERQTHGSLDDQQIRLQLTLSF